MLEKDIENLIAQHPNEFFPYSGFKLIGQQVKIGSCFADIIFMDKHQRKVIVEVKRGVLSRDASGQVMEYYGLLKNQNPADIIELVLCANVIPQERKAFLERVGIECKELGISLINQVADKFGYTFINTQKQYIEISSSQLPISESEKTHETEYSSLVSLPNQSSITIKTSDKSESYGADEFIMIIRDKLLEEDNNNWNISRGEGCLHARHLPSIKKIEHECGKELITQIWMPRLKNGHGRCVFEVVKKKRSTDKSESDLKHDKIVDSLRSFMSLNGLPKEFEKAEKGLIVIKLKINWSKNQTEESNNNEVLKVIDFYKFLDTKLTEWNKCDLVNLPER